MLRRILALIKWRLQKPSPRFFPNCAAGWVTYNAARAAWQKAKPQRPTRVPRGWSIQRRAFIPFDAKRVVDYYRAQWPPYPQLGVQSGRIQCARPNESVRPGSHAAEYPRGAAYTDNPANWNGQNPDESGMPRLPERGGKLFPTRVTAATERRRKA